jgi:hypothetical protein
MGVSLTRTCWHCGRAFEPMTPGSGTKLCSPECKYARGRQLKGDWERENPERRLDWASVASRMRPPQTKGAK